MKILHIIAGMPPESGIAAVVTRLAVEQQRLAHQVCVASTEKREVLKFEPASLRATPSRGSPKVLKLERENIEHPTSNIQYPTGEGGMRVATFQRSWPQAAYFSWGMLMGLGKEVQEADVVHVHSSWTFPVWWGAWLALRHKKTLVMSPHGAFNPLQLKHSAWKKRLVGGMDRWLLRRASVIHATCEAEAEWVRDFLKSEAGGQRSASFANRASTFANTLPADKTAARVAVGSSSRQRGADETPVRQSATIVVIPNGVEGRDK